MGEKIELEGIECCGDAYQIDFRHTESGISDRVFVRKDALFALITVAEKQAIDGGNYVVG